MQRSFCAKRFEPNVEAGLRVSVLLQMSVLTAY